MVHFLREYGYSLLFLAILAENLGLPVPSQALVLAAAPPQQPVAAPTPSA
jgi:membrane protein YqaA with SNARE-associated domain